MVSKVSLFVYFYQTSNKHLSHRITLTDSSPALSAPVKSSKASSSKSATVHPFTVKWERRKKIGYAPGRRVGCTMAGWSTRDMGVLFGGVTDEDTNEETLESVYHNDMCVFYLLVIFLGLMRNLPV